MAKMLKSRETKKYQRIAEKTGTMSPRGLARSVAKNARRIQGIKESEIKGWRQIFKEYAAYLKNRKKSNRKVTAV